jgi:hypothetical protein
MKMKTKMKKGPTTTTKQMEGVMQCKKLRRSVLQCVGDEL